MEMLTVKEVCRLFKVHRTTLDRWQVRHGFPRPVRIGARAVRWMAKDVERWQAERRQSEVEAQG